MAGVITMPAGNYLVDVSLNFTNTTSNGLECVGTLNKNGAVFNSETKYAGEAGVGGQNVGNMITHSVFMALNGTDTVSYTATVTFAAGAAETIGTIRFVAI